MSWIVLDCGETINQTVKYSLSNRPMHLKFKNTLLRQDTTSQKNITLVALLSFTPKTNLKIMPPSDPVTNCVECRGGGMHAYFVCASS